MRCSVSIIIPAWNEGSMIGTTLRALHQSREESKWWDEIIVIDDGSKDNTYEEALPWADQIIIHQKNKGKGTAMEEGCKHAKHPILLLLDADLGESAGYASLLLGPIDTNEADMTIAKFAPPLKKGGFGLVKGLAVHGIYNLSGYMPMAPLSGQRAIRKEILKNTGGLSKGFGIEVGLTIDAVRSGYRVVEVDVPFQHRETGRNLSGFVHRGKQFIAVGRALIDKWWNPIC
jgi:glycosyltransferase involved in cell wall biosynthesis